MSMKDKEFPLYESIHSSMLQDSSNDEILAFATERHFSSTEDNEHTLCTPAAAPSTASVKENSFDSYVSSKIPISASEPIYENLPGVLSNSPELVDPSFNTEDRETHVVSIKPLYKGKRRSPSTDVPSPPSKKRNRTTKFASSISKKRNSTKNLKKQKKEENSQIPLSAIPESWTPKKGFQFFGTPSFKKSKKFTAPEQDASPTQLSLFSRDKSKSKKRLPKKLEISAPLELLPPPIPENPLRRLRPRK